MASEASPLLSRDENNLNQEKFFQYPSLNSQKRTTIESVCQSSQSQKGKVGFSRIGITDAVRQTVPPRYIMEPPGLPNDEVKSIGKRDSTSKPLLALKKAQL